MLHSVKPKINFENIPPQNVFFYLPHDGMSLHSSTSKFLSPHLRPPLEACFVMVRVFVRDALVALGLLQVAVHWEADHSLH